MAISPVVTTQSLELPSVIHLLKVLGTPRDSTGTLARPDVTRFMLALRLCPLDIQFPTIPVGYPIDTVIGSEIHLPTSRDGSLKLKRFSYITENEYFPGFKG